MNGQELLPSPPHPKTVRVSPRILNFSLLHVLWVDLPLGASLPLRRMALLSSCFAILRSPKLLLLWIRDRVVGSTTLSHTETQGPPSSLHHPAQKPERLRALPFSFLFRYCLVGTRDQQCIDGEWSSTLPVCELIPAAPKPDCLVAGEKALVRSRLLTLLVTCLAKAPHCSWHMLGKYLFNLGCF